MRPGSLADIRPLRRVGGWEASRTVRTARKTARQAFGLLTPGVHITGVNAGQFGIGDTLEAILAQTGPASVLLSTWRMHPVAVEKLRELTRLGDIRSLRLLTDESFPGVAPDAARLVLNWLGAEAVRTTKTHMKVVVVTNERWAVTVRGTFNLVGGIGMELFDLDESANVAAFFANLFDRIWQQGAPGYQFGAAQPTLGGEDDLGWLFGGARG
jgi:hypothetical protein